MFGIICPGVSEQFKTSQKTGPQLKVSSDRLVERGIERRSPGYKGSDLSTTKGRPLNSGSITKFLTVIYSARTSGHFGRFYV